MALVADSGPVTSAQRGQLPGFLSLLNAILRRMIIIPLTSLQAIDGLVSSLGLVSLGHDGGDSVTS